jgi:hypothetical protein
MCKELNEKYPINNRDPDEMLQRYFPNARGRDIPIVIKE